MPWYQACSIYTEVGQQETYVQVFIKIWFIWWISMWLMIEEMFWESKDYDKNNRKLHVLSRCKMWQYVFVLCLSWTWYNDDY